MQLLIYSKQHRSIGTSVTINKAAVYANYSLHNCIVESHKATANSRLLQTTLYNLIVSCLGQKFKCREGRHNATVQLCGYVHIVRSLQYRGATHMSLITLYSHKNMRLNVTFLEFNLPWSRHCLTSSMHINEPNRTKYCGHLPKWSTFMATTRLTLTIFITQPASWQVLFRYESMLVEQAAKGSTVPDVFELATGLTQHNVLTTVYTYQQQSFNYHIFVIRVHPCDVIYIDVDSRLPTLEHIRLDIFDGPDVLNKKILTWPATPLLKANTSAFAATLFAWMPLKRGYNEFMISYKPGKNRFAENSKYVFISNETEDANVTVALERAMVRYIIDMPVNTFMNVYIDSFSAQGYDNELCLYSGIYITSVERKDSDVHRSMCSSFFTGMLSDNGGPLHVYSSDGSNVVIIMYVLHNQLNISLRLQSSVCMGIVVFACTANNKLPSQVLQPAATNHLEKGSNSCLSVIVVYDKMIQCHLTLGNINKEAYYQFNLIVRQPEMADLFIYTKCSQIIVMREDVFIKYDHVITNGETNFGRELSFRALPTHNSNCLFNPALVVAEVRMKTCLDTIINDHIYNRLIDKRLPTDCGHIGFHYARITSDILIRHIMLPISKLPLKYYQFQITGEFCDACLHKTVLIVLHRETTYYWSWVKNGFHWNSLDSRVVLDLRLGACRRRCTPTLEYKLASHYPPTYADNRCSVSHGNYQKEYFVPNTKVASWEQAAITCGQHNGQLVSFYNKDELLTFLSITLDHRCQDVIRTPRVWSGYLTYIGLRYDSMKVTDP